MTAVPGHGVWRWVCVTCSNSKSQWCFSHKDGYRDDPTLHQLAFNTSHFPLFNAYDSMSYHNLHHIQGFLSSHLHLSFSSIKNITSPDIRSYQLSQNAPLANCIKKVDDKGRFRVENNGDLAVQWTVRVLYGCLSQELISLKCSEYKSTVRLTTMQILWHETQHGPWNHTGMHTSTHIHGYTNPALCAQGHGNQFHPASSQLWWG